MTKKFLLGLAVCLWIALGTNAWADFVYEDYTYTVWGGEITITGYIGTGGTASIPSYIDGMYVVKIADRALRNETSLTRIRVPNTVIDIGNEAFAGCTNVTLILLGTDVETIGDSAFYNCSSLTTQRFPDTVTSIGDYVFNGCNALTYMNLRESGASIGKRIFINCTTVPEIIVHPDNPVYSDIDGILYNKTATRLILCPPGKSGELTIPDTVTNIAEDAFYNCGALTNIIMPDSVISIGSSAFENCTGLTNITISESVASIEPYTFQDCTSLSSITIPDSVTNIGDFAFENCRDLTSMILGNSVSSIGDSAFELCRTLTSVVIPASVTSIGNSAFRNCFNLATAYFLGDPPAMGDDVFVYWGSDFNICYIAGNTGFTTPIWEGYPSAECACSHDTDCADYETCVDNACADLSTDLLYSVSDGQITITGYTGPGGAVDIPDSLHGMPIVSIGPYAFYDCGVLTSLTVGSNVTTIEQGAFMHCWNLTAVTLGNNVTTIGDYAFRDCDSLNDIDISGRVSNIGFAAFEYCSGLTSVAFLNSVESIGGEAFKDCSGLTSVSIPNSVTSIEDRAFYRCSNLTSVTLGDSVTSIGFSVFADCLSLTDILVDTNNPAYSSHDGVLYTKDITVLISYPAKKSGDFTIPGSVTSIDSSAFYGCSALTDITIPSSVTHIGSSAFTNCNSLTSVTIPGSVSDIESAAFIHCDSLEIAYFLGDAPSMGSSVFYGAAHNFKVCYEAEATGFTASTWEGYPAQVCICSYTSDCAEDYECIEEWCTLTAPGYWAWMGGSNTRDQFGVYGTKGIPDAANVPGARRDSISWTDSSGNLWLLGGSNPDGDILNDLWRYDPSLDLWTWVEGSNTPNQIGAYGTKGIADATNMPGARSHSISWTGRDGNLWLFGGGGITDDSWNYLNDLWRYEPDRGDNGTWTWMNGADTTFLPAGIFGTKGVPDPSNVPSGRGYSVSWTDNDGNFWLFGGYTHSGAYGYYLNDLWRYEPDRGDYGTWTWMSGSNMFNQYGTYGSMGEPSTNNVPGARRKSVSWTDKDGNFWLFGGYGYGDEEVYSYTSALNDLWRYEPASGMWTWMNGSNLPWQDSNYGTMGEPSPNNDPGARLGSSSWTDNSSNLWLFGGRTGIARYDVSEAMSDLWRYEPASGLWTWMSGSNVLNQDGTYGTKGEAGENNVPDTRGGGVSWTDSDGNFWLFGGAGDDKDGDYGYLNDLWLYKVPPECETNSSCLEGEECVDGKCILPADNSPTINNGPFLAAGSWPLLSTTSSENPMYLKQNVNVLWTFSDDKISCSGDCTHVAEYQAVGAAGWTGLEVIGDKDQGVAYAQLPIDTLSNATTYAFRFSVTDCATQSAQSQTYYFRVATEDNPPVIEAGPFLAAGTWPALSKAESRAFVIAQDEDVLWSFDDDYATCSDMAWHRARYHRIVDDGTWIWEWLDVSTDSTEKEYAYARIPASSMEAGTYMFVAEIIDCDGQLTRSTTSYFKVESPQ